MSIRTERIASIILKNVTEILRNDVKDPAIGFVTVTDVTVTNDLSYAKIYVTFLDRVDQVEYRMKALNRVKGLVRSKLAKSLSTRKCPEVIFVYDDSLQVGNHIEEVLKDLNK